MLRLSPLISRNSPNVAYFWQNWNIPVHRWARRLVYSCMHLLFNTIILIIVFIEVTGPSALQASFASHSITFRLKKLDLLQPYINFYLSHLMLFIFLSLWQASVCSYVKVWLLISSSTGCCISTFCIFP